MGQPCELCLEIFEIWVVVHRSDVIGQRKRGRYRLNSDFIVESEMVEQSLLIT